MSAGAAGVLVRLGLGRLSVSAQHRRYGPLDFTVACVLLAQLNTSPHCHPPAIAASSCPLITCLSILAKCSSKSPFFGRMVESEL